MSDRSQYLAVFLIVVLIVGFMASALFPCSPNAHTMPTTVDLNGTQWRIQVVEVLAPDVVGYTECDKHVIYVLKVQRNIHEALVHELSHAAVCVDGLFVTNNEYFNQTTNSAHEGIYHFAEIWSEILTRNPQLAAYLGSKE